MLLLIGEAKCKFVLGGEWRTFGCEIPKHIIEMNILCQTTVSCTMLLTGVKHQVNQKGCLISPFPLFAAFHGVEVVVWDNILDTQVHVRLQTDTCNQLVNNLLPKFYWSNLIKSFCLRDRGRLGNEGQLISLKIGTQSRHVDLCSMPKFQVQRPFFSRVLDISPLGVPRGWFSVQYWPLFHLSFSNVQVFSDKTKSIFVKPYS